MHIKQFLLILLLFLFCVNSYALDLTKITNKNNKINIELNNILYLQDFVLVDDKLVSPFYENNGTKYYFFSFLNRKTKQENINKIKNKEQIVNKKLNEKIEYKINKCSIVKKPKTILAFMSVIFNDEIEINCNILNGKYGLWVSWASLKENNKWRKLFDIKDKKLKDEIETALIKYYKQKRNDDKLKEE